MCSNIRLVGAVPHAALESCHRPVKSRGTTREPRLTCSIHMFGSDGGGSEEGMGRVMRRIRANTELARYRWLQSMRLQRCVFIWSALQCDFYAPIRYGRLCRLAEFVSGLRQCACQLRLKGYIVHSSEFYKTRVSLRLPFQGPAVLCA